MYHFTHIVNVVVAQATKQRIADMKTEVDDIVSQQNVLKKDLYARFGDTINLEN